MGSLFPTSPLLLSPRDGMCMRVLCVPRRQLHVASNEATRGYRVAVQRSGQSGDNGTSFNASFPVDVSADNVITTTVTLQGYLTITAFALDVAGNQDTVGKAVSVVVVSQPPAAVVTTPPPALTNSSSLSFAVSGVDADPRVLAYFRLTWFPPSTTLPVQAHAGVGSASAVVNLTSLSSGAYAATAVAVDVLGNGGSPAAVSFVVDTDPPIVTFASPLPLYSNTSTLAVLVMGSDELSFVGMTVSVRHSAGSPAVVVDDWNRQVSAYRPLHTP